MDYLPFLRARYGRAIFYMVSGLVIYIMSGGSMMENLCASLMSFAGMLIGLIAMQPNNPYDYRGFQRPEGNDFLSRMQSMSAHSFDTMAAQYISLSSSQYLENRLNTES